MTRKNKVPRAKAANKLDLPSQAERMFLARLDAVLAKSSDAVGLVMRMNAKVRQSLNDVEAVEGAVEAKVARLEAKAVVAKTSVVVGAAPVGAALASGGGYGQKVNPVGLRLGVNPTWDSRWFADGNQYGKLLHQDLTVRAVLKKRLYQAGVSRIIIERPHKKCRVTIYAARPGVIIGKKGADIDKLRKDLSVMTEGEVHLNIVEIRKPETDAQLVAESIAQQLERRIAFRRAMKRSIQSAVRLGAKGIRINVSGRLGGAEIARMEWYREGRVPLHTLRADIDFGFAEAKTTYGIIGVKTWIFKGEVLEHDPMALDKRLATESGPAGEGGGRERGDRPDRGDRRDRRDRA